MSTPGWDEINERRLDLIDRAIDKIITSAEAVELEGLQARADAEFRPMHERAMARLDAKRS